MRDWLEAYAFHWPGTERQCGGRGFRDAIRDDCSDHRPFA
jgi:hypothetical protein